MYIYCTTCEGVVAMLEKELEKYLYEQCKKYNLLCLKNITIKGFPDRTIIDELGNVHFVELKRDGGMLSPAQLNVIAMLEDRNCNVHVLYGKKHVNKFLFMITGGVHIE